MLRRTIISLFTLILSIVMVTGTTFAADGNLKEQKIPFDKMSEEAISNILVNKIGYPEEDIHKLSESLKQDLVESYFELDGKFTFVSREETNYADTEQGLIEVAENDLPSGEFGIMGVIPTYDLKLTFSIFDAYFSGVHYKRIYLDYYWQKDLTSIKNNRLGMAIASGWEIKGSSGVCKSNVRYGTQTLSYNCGGRPMNSSIYGYSWDIGAGTGTGIYARHDGYVKLDARKVNSGALNRIVGQYARDTTSSGSTSISVSWGPTSISHTVSGSGSLDTAGVDKTW